MTHSVFHFGPPQKMIDDMQKMKLTISKFLEGKSQTYPRSGHTGLGRDPDGFSSLGKVQQQFATQILRVHLHGVEKI